MVMMSKENIYVIYELLKSINKTIHREVGSKLGYKNVNPSVMAILFFLMDGEARTLKEISAGVGLANSTVSGIIDRLVEKGMVQRVQDKGDRRRVLISVTENTKKMYCESEAEFRGYLEKILGKASDDDLRVVSEGLTKLYDIIREGER